MSEQQQWELIRARNQGVLATLKRDGRPQLSNVTYAADPTEPIIRISVTDGRAKIHNARRDPRVSFYVTSDDFAAYVVAEGRAELSDVAADLNDAAVSELIELYRAARGEHPDWDEYRAAMVTDRRLVLRVRVERLYGRDLRG